MQRAGGAGPAIAHGIQHILLADAPQHAEKGAHILMPAIEGLTAGKIVYRNLDDPITGAEHLDHHFDRKFGAARNQLIADIIKAGAPDCPERTAHIGEAALKLPP